MRAPKKVPQERIDTMREVCGPLRALSLTCCIQRFGWLDGMDEVIGSKDTVNISRVVAKKDTAERCESAHEIRLPRYRGLDATDIGGRGDRPTARHDRGCCSDI